MVTAVTVTLLVHIGASLTAGVQTITRINTIEQARIASGVITIVRSDEGMMQSVNGRVTWRTFAGEHARRQLNELQHRLKRQQLMALAAKSGTVTGATASTCEVRQAGEVLLMLYDDHGNEVFRQLDSAVHAGTHSIVFDATPCSDGVYYYQVTVNSANATSGNVVIERSGK
jgi:hypothetical protein